ncbi:MULTISPECIES: YajQ family cyclic di-GMP-binding protein [Nevskia]|uniref:YajQ family cyclic di-GMP-binding protein n=1 Tax=Nevskia TaxID=64001 RepID=UPI0003B44963|nr:MULTISPECIES: YajQ family cyclic di-GMP-binding protein [Nevskia]
MPSFDVISEVDKHELTNAIDQARRDLGNRYDLRGTDARFEQEDDNVITQFAPTEYQLDQLLEMLRLRLAGRHIDLRCIELGDVETNLAGARRKITIKQGIEQLQAKKIIAKIKEAKLKVDCQIQGEKLRINGKKRDDLQTTIAFLKKAELEVPLQFENFRD